MKLFGIRIRVHPTFIWLLLIFLAFGGWSSVFLTLVVFAFVVLHELSHSMVARAYGIHVQDITLLPIGGVARFGSMPEHPGTEFAISIAGPALNFAVVGLVYAVRSLAGPWLSAPAVDLLNMVFYVNLVLGTFNLLPAFPMDGGRLLRAFLATGRGYLRATQIAVLVGRAIAVGMVAISFATMFMPEVGWNWWLLIIAAFIWVSGKQEEMAVAARHGASGFWRLFGHAEPWTPGRPDTSGDRAYVRPRVTGDVIDVKGEVRRSSDDDVKEAADAFRKLAEDLGPR